MYQIAIHHDEVDDENDEEVVVYVETTKNLQKVTVHG